MPGTGRVPDRRWYLQVCREGQSGRDEVFGPMIVDHANLGEHSSGTHAVATLLAIPKVQVIAADALALALLTDKHSAESISRALEPDQTYQPKITSNSWGSDSSSHYADAWATLQPGQPLPTDDGYIMRH